MSDQNSGLFSESQLSQIATMMPSLASKSKIESGAMPLSKDIEVEPVASASAEEFKAQSEETKNGILRLADYINRQKKSKAPVQTPEKKTAAFVKEVSMKKHLFAPIPQEALRRGLDTYGWVEDHKSLAIGTCINKFF